MPSLTEENNGPSILKISAQAHASLEAAPDTPKGLTLLWETAEVPA